MSRLKNEECAAQIKTLANGMMAKQLTVESGSPLKGCPTDKEKLMLHEEFLSAMQDKFMRGEEEEFDYSTVDTNDEYDDLKIRERDEEERYFDDDIAN